MNGAGSNLVGKFFLTFDEDREIRFQGQVLRCLGSGYFLCQLFSAITGEPTNSIVQPVHDMKGWKFYGDEAQWHRAYDAAAAKLRLRCSTK
ncbi:MAG: hypothetical protein IT553_00365 [Sphingomonadaceae bacterium]|nr:hypothetical protein [Sphingomonadaceae bacterium]